MNLFADEILKQDGITFKDITPKTKNGKAFIEAIKEEALEKLGYFLKPEELFTEVAKRGKGDNEDDVDKFDEMSPHVFFHGNTVKAEKEPGSISHNVSDL